MHEQKPLDGEMLQGHVASGIVEKLGQGDLRSLNDWIQDGFYSRTQIGALQRASTIFKIRDIVTTLERNILKYLYSLIAGFNLPYAQKSYLSEEFHIARHSIKFPIFNYSEIEECLDQMYPPKNPTLLC